MMAQRCVWLRLNRFVVPPETLRSLQLAFTDVDFLSGKDSALEPTVLKRVDAVFTDEALPDWLVEAMPNLKWLHVTRGGVYPAYWGAQGQELPPMLSPTIRQRPIQVSTSTGIHGPSFTEHGLAFIFALAKKMPQILEAQSKKNWESHIRPEQLEGKTLGILGLGTVGSELARKAKALGLYVVATKRSAEAKPTYVDELGPAAFLSKLLSQADFVTVCLPSVPSTDRLLGERELRSMKRTAYLINLTAGRVVEEKLLVRSLKEGWIAGAALDVTPRMPLPPDSELWSLHNVIISPFVGGAGGQRFDQILSIFVDNLRRFLSGNRLRNLVDKDLGYARP